MSLKNNLVGGAMIYTEVKQDLFEVDHTYYLAHCISADFGMAKGIAVQFNYYFDMRNKLKKKYPGYLQEFRRVKQGDCILEGEVFNLITKEHYYDKPTYKSLTQALTKCRDLCEEHNIKKIAMPVIGCGLDRLSWDRVSSIIWDIFFNTDIEILVCKQ